MSSLCPQGRPCKEASHPHPRSVEPPRDPLSLLTARKMRQEGCSTTPGCQPANEFLFPLREESKATRFGILCHVLCFGDMDEYQRLDESSFDVIIVGTGLTESVHTLPI